MSVITFELKEEHVKLLKNLKWKFGGKHFELTQKDILEEVSPSVNFIAEFVGDNVYDDIDLILNGKPANFDPFKTEEVRVYTQEEKDAMDKLVEELPTALDIVLFNGNYEIGTYITRYHDRQWKKKNV